MKPVENSQISNVTSFLLNIVLCTRFKKIQLKIKLLAAAGKMITKYKRERETNVSKVRG